MKKFLIFLLFFVSLIDLKAQVRNYSTNDLRVFNTYIRPLRFERKIPAQPFPATLPQFLGNITTDTLLKYFREELNTSFQPNFSIKANINNPTFTGTVSGITKSMIGLANVDNTSDLLKPISTATQTALDLKANLISPTFTGNVKIAGITKSDKLIINSSVDNGNSLQIVGNSNITDGNLGVGIASPASRLQIYNGKIIAGTSSATDGTIVLESQYDQNGTLGTLSSLGTNASTGGWVLSYGVAPKISSNGNFYSTTSLAVPKSAIIIEGDIRFFTGAAESKAISTDVSIIEAVRITTNGNVGIGTLTPTSTLHNAGSEANSIVTISAAATLGNNYYVIASGASTYLVTLPSASSCVGRTYAIKTTGANKTISSFINISGTATTNLTANTVIYIVSDGTNWQQF